ncbi:zinc finger protein 75A-like isoform X1 [Zerene cesonia]|uniref:zinc finger protein 75A-like isoform X1 n=1 Tax=Zerene cesonia TaxID=33412 RepID=UPI0018E51F2E|nr:zinc finger protein 75A-like isoform X1 [Zerene cesonia]
MNNEGNNEIVILDAAGPSNILIEKLDENCQQPASSGPEDFSFMCRICALKTRNIMNLFEDEGAEQKLVEKINKYLPLKVSQGDGLPEVICYQCSNAVLAWHELVECCMQADASFRKQLVLAAQGNGISSTTKGSVNHLDEDSLKFKKMLADTTLYTEAAVNEKAQDKKCNYCNADNFAYFEIYYSKCSKDNLLKICLTCGRGYPTKEDIEITFQQSGWRLLPNTVVSSNINLMSTNLRISNIEIQNNEDLNACEPNDTFNFESVNAENILSESHDEINVEITNHDDNNCSTVNARLTDVPVNSEAIELSSNASRDPSEANCAENEFSDHSDVESFAQLPDSVFEAIEDTQDSIDQDEGKCTRSPARANAKQKSRTCPICGKVYTASSSYFYHKKHFHGRVKNYSCDVCDKKFGTRSDLVQHGAVHTGERKFACSMCEKRFRSKASLYIHEQTHKGVKIHKCTKCERSFRWIAHLTRHMQRHDAVKKHECAVCGRGFTIRCDLLRHARTHTVGSYQCEKCEVKFAQIRYLKAHMVKKHGVAFKSGSDE